MDERLLFRYRIRRRIGRVGDGLLEMESGSIVEGEGGTTTDGQSAVGGWIQIVDSLNVAKVLLKSWREEPQAFISVKHAEPTR